MSYLTISFPRGKVVKPRCECCRETKPEPNQKPVCDTCAELGCAKKPWGNYKRPDGCPLMVKRRKKNPRCQATRAWNRREKMEKSAAGR